MDKHPTDVVTEKIIGAAITVHKKFGPGLLESVYTTCLGQELLAMGLEVEISKPLSLEHAGLHIQRAFVVDIFVENCVVVEVKSVRRLSDIDFAQLLTYLRLTGIRVGLLINFNEVLVKAGIRRVVNDHAHHDGRPVNYPAALTEGADHD